jgi:hypothetical protein
MRQGGIAAGNSVAKRHIFVNNFLDGNKEKSFIICRLA